MEVESEDEEDERGGREDRHAAQLDQDTQLQDMDEVRQPGLCSHNAIDDEFVEVG